MQSKIGAIIVNYNNPTDTRESLRSLLNSYTGNEYKLVIYLVNNGCADLESDKLPKEFPDIVKITSDKNLGFAGGNNLGIKQALTDSCTHILLLNNDATIISDHFFEKLLLSPYGITAPVIEYLLNGKKTRDYGGKVDYLFGRNTHLHHPAKADYFSGACLFIRSEVFSKIGGLDETFFLYYEDTDFCLRAVEAGVLIGNLRGVKVFHRLSASTNKLGKQKIAILARSHLIFCRRHLSLFASPFYTFYNLYLRFKLSFL